MGILIIDDNTHRQRQLCQILASLGFTQSDVELCPDYTAVLCRSNLRALTHIFVCVPPSARLALELIQQLQSSQSTSAIVVAYSPGPTRECIIRATRAGCSRFLIYPFSISSVEEVLSAPS